MRSYSRTPANGRDCAELAGLDYGALEECVQLQGEDLLKSSAELSLARNAKYAPFLAG